MSLFHLFTRNEPIAGLEVSDDVLRVSLLELVEKKKGGSEPAVGLLAEQPLEEGTVVNGLLADKGKFVQALKTLFKQSRIKVRYLVLSIPSQAVYSKTCSFPAIVQGEKLEEAMKLIVDFQLPYKKEEAYCDWEKTGNSASSLQQEVLLAAVHKSVVDAYLAAFGAAELNLVAVEFHPLSMIRAADFQEENACLVVSPNKNSSEISLVRNNSLYFHRVIPHSFIPGKALGEETRKAADFFESETGLKVSKALMIGDVSVKAPINLSSLEKKDQAHWLVSIGAASRGLLSRAEDTLISLMPVGTEEAYECQKAASFSGFLLSIAISLALFFAVAFAGVWMLMKTLEKNMAGKADTLASLPVQNDWLALETKARELNKIVGSAGAIIKNMPEWSMALEDVQSRVNEGIRITEFSLPSGGIITIKGIAKNRAQLNEFRKTLETSHLLTEVKLPLTNLEQREDIPFSIHSKVKDPANLFRE